MPQGGGTERKRNRKSSGTEGASDTSKLGGSVKRDPGTEGRAEARTAKDPRAEESEARVTKRDPVWGTESRRGCKGPGDWGRAETGGAKQDPVTGENQGRGQRGAPGPRRESRGPDSVLRPGTGGVPRLGRKVGLGNEEGKGGPRPGPLLG